jgi:hypothetical protein
MVADQHTVEPAGFRAWGKVTDVTAVEYEVGRRMDLRMVTMVDHAGEFDEHGGMFSAPKALARVVRASAVQNDAQANTRTVRWVRLIPIWEFCCQAKSQLKEPRPPRALYTGRSVAALAALDDGARAEPLRRCLLRLKRQTFSAHAPSDLPLTGREDLCVLIPYAMSRTGLVAPASCRTKRTGRNSC